MSLIVLKDFEVAPHSLLLATSWVLLVLALILAVVVVKLNQESHNHYLAIMDQECAKGLEGFLERTQVRQSTSVWRKALRFTEWAALIACLAGLGVLFLASYQGIMSEDHANGTTTTSTATATTTASTLPAGSGGAATSPGATAAPNSAAEGSARRTRRTTSSPS